MFDYIFYRVYLYYKKNNDSTPIFQACGVTTFIIFFNVLGMYSLFDYFLHIDPPYMKVIVGTFGLIVLLLLRHRYSSDEKISELERRFSNESASLKNRNKILIIVYVIFSIAILIVMSNLRN